MSTTDKADRFLKIEGEIHIDAPPEKVFEALTTGLDRWWPFRTRPDAKIVYETQVGGRIYEDWGNGAATLYSQVVEYDPPRSSVSIGPGGIGLSAFNSRNIDEVVRAEKGGSIYKKTLLFWGLVSEETAEMYKTGSGRLSQILKEYLETGKGYEAPK